MSDSAREFWQLWHQFGVGDRQKTQEWVVALRDEGVKAAHPDDGWHERGKHRVKLMYPDFNDGVAVGDQVALGRPGKWRVVTVIAIDLPVLGVKPWYRY